MGAFHRATFPSQDVGPNAHVSRQHGACHAIKASFLYYGANGKIVNCLDAVPCKDQKLRERWQTCTRGQMTSGFLLTDELRRGMWRP
jgi:hypothetical protein